MDQNNQTERRFQTVKVYTSSRDSSDATPFDVKFTNFTTFLVITLFILQHLCQGVYSFRHSVHPFVHWYVCLIVLNNDNVFV